MYRKAEYQTSSNSKNTPDVGPQVGGCQKQQHSNEKNTRCDHICTVVHTPGNKLDHAFSAPCLPPSTLPTCLPFRPFPRKLVMTRTRQGCNGCRFRASLRVVRSELRPVDTRALRSGHGDVRWSLWPYFRGKGDYPSRSVVKFVNSGDFFSSFATFAAFKKTVKYTKKNERVESPILEICCAGGVALLFCFAFLFCRRRFLMVKTMSPQLIREVTHVCCARLSEGNSYVTKKATV